MAGLHFIQMHINRCIEIKEYIHILHEKSDNLIKKKKT